MTRRLSVYGTGVPPRWRRWTPSGRKRMREQLSELLTVAEQNAASEEFIRRIRAELRHYGGGSG